MTDGNVAFDAEAYNLGDTMTANFSWQDAKQLVGTEDFVEGYIFNPEGNNCNFFTSQNPNYDGWMLTCVANMIGTWIAKMWIGTITGNITREDDAYVVLEGYITCNVEPQYIEGPIGNYEFIATILSD